MAKVRILYQIGPDFKGFSPGAAWDDVKLGLTHHLTARGRNAVVTDIGGIRNSMRFFKFLLPRGIKIFSTVEIQEAKDWIVP